MKVRKRKVRIKWKNLLALLVFTFLLIFGLTEIIICISKAFSSPKEEKVEVKVEKKVSKKTNMEKLSYYNNNYKNRYKEYKENNKDLSDEQIVKNVNMNLDLETYKNTFKAKNLNTNKILVNKYYYLEEDYEPDNLETISKRFALEGMEMVSEAKNAFEDMAKDAEKEGLSIIAMSCYRSYNYQVKIYNQYVKADGQEKVDTYSGRPGHSEHQTGLAVDVYNGKVNYTKFESTKEFEWMNEHAYKYGFILRFPKDKENETGYMYESWHYRYVGKEIANYIKENNISFEEYYATKIKDW